MSDPIVDDIKAEFPAWHVWLGVNEMVYAQHRGSPPLTFREENGTELRARIASWYRTYPEPVLGSWPRAPWEEKSR